MTERPLLGRLAGRPVWQRVLREHPSLIGVFAAADVLAEARRTHPRLDQVITRFGPPPDDLLTGPSATGVHDDAWRRLVREHPAALDLLTPGNEARLARFRSSSEGQGLDKLIRMHGLPRPQLLAAILNGEDGPGVAESALRTHSAVAMPFDPSNRLSEEQLHHFFAEGFTVLRGAVPRSLVDAALRHINACLGRGAISRDVPTLVGLLPSESRAPPIVDLFFGEGSKLPTAAQCLVGRGKVQPPAQAQIALKFPTPAVGGGTNAAPAAEALPPEHRPIGGRAWHVDGFGEGRHSPFTLLLGVCLSDVGPRGCGNFAVHPGAHWGMQQQVIQAIASGDELMSAMNEDRRKLDLGEPLQLEMRAGDAVLAHQKLPHLGCPNFSPHVRYQVYFRLGHVDLARHRQAWLDDLLLPFEGVRDVVG